MKTIYVFLFIALFLTEKHGQEQGPLSVRHVSVQEFKKLMETLNDEVVIDLRTPDEIDQGKIEGSIEIDFFSDGFEPAITALDRDKVYLLYCGSGGRSGETSELMSKLGFRKIYNMEGGFKAWRKNKLPVHEP